MGQVNFDEAEGLEIGKRYEFVIVAAKDGESKSGTPFLELELDPQFNHRIYLSPKALSRAREWFEAMGLPSAGVVQYDADRLPGIRFSASVFKEEFEGNDGTTKWSLKLQNPQRVVIGADTPSEPAPMRSENQRDMKPLSPKPLPKEEPATVNEMDDVPF